MGPSDFDRYSIVAPVDPGLPGGGGFLIDDLYDVSPARFGQVNNFVTSASRFGKQIEYWNGMDASINARLRNGLTLQGGFSIGRTVRDQCDVVPKIDNPSRRFCRTKTLFLTQVTGFAAYTVPRLDIQLSGTFLSKDGPELAAIYNVPSADIAPSLGRPLSGNTPNVAVNLIEPAHPLWRTAQPARRSSGEAHTGGPDAHAAWRGRLQCIQRRLYPDVQSDVRPEVVDADIASAGAIRQTQRAD